MPRVAETTVRVSGKKSEARGVTSPLSRLSRLEKLIQFNSNGAARVAPAIPRDSQTTRGGRLARLRLLSFSETFLEWWEYSHHVFRDTGGITDLQRAATGRRSRIVDINYAHTYDAARARTHRAHVAHTSRRNFSQILSNTHVHLQSRVYIYVHMRACNAYIRVDVLPDS